MLLVHFGITRRFMTVLVTLAGLGVIGLTTLNLLTTTVSPGQWRRTEHPPRVARARGGPVPVDEPHDAATRRRRSLLATVATRLVLI